MWILRRLNALGAKKHRLIDVLLKQMLSVLTLKVPAWDCLLTEQEMTDLSRVLMTGLRIIWGAEYTTFEDILHISHLKDLQVVRDKIVRKFVSKSEQHKKFSEWFAPQNPRRVLTR